MHEPSLLISLLPFLLLTLICFLFAIPISRRKGKGIGFAAFCLVPFLYSLHFVLLGEFDGQVRIGPISST